MKKIKININIKVKIKFNIFSRPLGQSRSRSAGEARRGQITKRDPGTRFIEKNRRVKNAPIHTNFGDRAICTTFYGIIPVSFFITNQQRFNISN